MSSPHKTQHSFSKYSFTTTNEKTVKEKSFISSSLPSKLQSSRGTNTKHLIQNYKEEKMISGSRNGPVNRIPYCRTMREKTETTKKIFQTINVNKTKGNRSKYSFVPNIEKMKHLDSDIIDSMLTLSPEPFVTSMHHNANSNGIEQLTFTETEKGNKTKVKIRKTRNCQSTKTRTKTYYNSNINEDIKPFESLTIAETEASLVPKAISRPSKLLLANLNESKKDVLLQRGLTLNSSKLNKLLSLPTIKRSSLIDRLVVKLNNPNDCIEDHDIDKRPGDIYKRFKNQLVKTKDHINRLVIDVQRSHNINRNLLKVYVSKLKTKKYPAY